MEKRTAMNKELKAKYDKVRDECGHEGYFRMVIAYVMDKGFDAVSQITFVTTFISEFVVFCFKFFIHRCAFFH